MRPDRLALRCAAVVALGAIAAWNVWWFVGVVAYASDDLFVAFVASATGVAWVALAIEALAARRSVTVVTASMSLLGVAIPWVAIGLARADMGSVADRTLARVTLAFAAVAMVGLARRRGWGLVALASAAFAALAYVGLEAVRFRSLGAFDVRAMGIGCVLLLAALGALAWLIWKTYQSEDDDSPSSGPM